MIIDSLLIFSSRFLTTFCMFRLQLYSCWGYRPVLYNFRGSEVYCYIMLYHGGGGLSKNQHFCVI